MHLILYWQARTRIIMLIINMITEKKFISLIREIDRILQSYMKKEIKKLSVEHCRKLIGDASKNILTQRYYRSGTICILLQKLNIVSSLHVACLTHQLQNPIAIG